MALTEEERIAQAVSEGYPDIDQVCPADGCGVVFKNYHHFIRCDRSPCPLSTGKTLFEHRAEIENAESSPAKAGGIEPGVKE
jgi:hypothetical protein